MFKALLFLLIINLTKQNCKNSSPFCLSCKQEQCLECIYSFKNNNNCQVPQVSIKNCMFYTPQGKCSFCDAQFTLQDGKCVPIKVVNCKHTKKQGECLICQDKLKLSHDKQCTDTCKLENCKNCATDILGNEFCAVCENGFSLNKFLRCQKEPVPHCDKVVKDKCVRCKIGYRHDGIKCHKVDYIKILEEKKNQTKIKKQTDKMVLLKSSNPQQEKKPTQQTSKTNKTPVKQNFKPTKKSSQQKHQVHQQKKPNVQNIPKKNQKTEKHHNTNQKQHTHKKNNEKHFIHHRENNRVHNHSKNPQQNHEKQQKNNSSNKIIVKADKLLNESQVNLETNKNANTQSKSQINIPNIFMILVISYLFNQII